MTERPVTERRGADGPTTPCSSTTPWQLDDTLAARRPDLYAAETGGRNRCEVSEVG